MEAFIQTCALLNIQSESNELANISRVNQCDLMVSGLYVVCLCVHVCTYEM